MLEELFYYFSPYVLFDLLQYFATAFLEVLYAVYDLLPY